MNIELKSEYVLSGDDETVIWKLDEGNGAIVRDLNKLLDIDIMECSWLGDDKKYIEAMHSDWNGMDYMAIITNQGHLIKKRINEIHEYIKDAELFAVVITGYGLGEEEATYYNVGHDDVIMAVIDKYGNYILKPEYRRIQYYDDEDVLYADGNIYDFNGNFIKKDQ